ncbi:MAG: PqqD family protein [Candidatus Omnitrophota bacterium]
MVKTVEKNPKIVFRKIGDETILVPVQSRVADFENIFALNETAARIWELIDGSRRTGDIANEVSEEFEVSLNQAKIDVSEFIQTLLNNKAVTAK